MDDTLLVTPTFADVMDQGGNERLMDFIKQAKQAFMLFMFKDIDMVTKGDFIILVDARTGSPLSSTLLTTMRERVEETEDSMKPEVFKKKYGIKRSSLKELLDVLGEKDGHIVVLQVRDFHAHPHTIGSTPNDEVEEAYRKAENKMILTGRKESLLFDIARRLKWLGLEYPNQGLHCYPSGKYKGIQQFKIATILQTIHQEGWTEVHFFEDREDWLNAAEEAVLKAYPHVRFVKHHITNVHDNRSL